MGLAFDRSIADSSFKEKYEHILLCHCCSFFSCKGNTLKIMCIIYKNNSTATNTEGAFLLRSLSSTHGVCQGVAYNTSNGLTIVGMCFLSSFYPKHFMYLLPLASDKMPYCGCDRSFYLLLEAKKYKTLPPPPPTPPFTHFVYSQGFTFYVSLKVQLGVIIHIYM